MKRHTYLPLAAVAVTAASLLASCEKKSDNGPIDGAWVMQEHYTRAADTPDAGYTVNTGVSNAPTIWSFQLNLLSIRTPYAMHNGFTPESVARFNLSGSELTVGPIYIHFRDRDSLMTSPDAAGFETVGVQTPETHFRVPVLTSSRMVLCSSRDSLVFRKS